MGKDAKHAKPILAYKFSADVERDEEIHVYRDAACENYLTHMEGEDKRKGCHVLGEDFRGKDSVWCLKIVV